MVMLTFKKPRPLPTKDELPKQEPPPIDPKSALSEELGMNYETLEDVLYRAREAFDELIADVDGMEPADAVKKFVKVISKAYYAVEGIEAELPDEEDGEETQ